jgi:hypothetical protein
MDKHSNTERLDGLAQRHTGFPTFDALIHAPEEYRPVLYTSRNAARRSTTAAERRELGDAYDARMRELGIPRWAER